MNFKIKIVLTVAIVVVLITFNCLMLINSVKAVNLLETTHIDLHSGGLCEYLLIYKGIPVKTTYVEYYGNNGKNYPAYCMDKHLSGVSDELEYTVTTASLIQDLGLWRTVINGYPYKSLEELGVADIDEAFTATKQAIYCYLYENTPEDYEAIGEAGERTLNALRKIVSDAENSQENIVSNTIEINAESKDWVEDEIDNKYISKIYSIKSQVKHINYEVNANLPDGGKITKLDGTEGSDFSENEKFKVMLLKDKLDKEGEFTLNIKTEVETKPVLYGASPNEEWQNYALSAYMFEDATNTFKDTYPKQEQPKIPEQPKQPVKETPKKQETPKILPVTGM